MFEQARQSCDRLKRPADPGLARVLEVVGCEGFLDLRDLGATACVADVAEGAWRVEARRRQLGQLVVLHGEPGSGKSESAKLLLLHFAATAPSPVPEPPPPLAQAGSNFQLRGKVQWWMAVRSAVCSGPSRPARSCVRRRWVG